MGSIPDTGGGKTARLQFTAVEERKAIDVRRNGNPAASEHPDGLKECDLASMGEKLIDVMYVDDGWVGVLKGPQIFHRA